MAVLQGLRTLHGRVHGRQCGQLKRQLGAHVTCCWGGKFDAVVVLVDSMTMLKGLRRLGLGAHGWR